VLLESTYGDRVHRPWQETTDELAAVFAEAEAKKGNVLIPAFAVGRTQMILYWMAEHFAAARLDRWQIFLDSPMAIQATRAYAQHPELFDASARTLWRAMEKGERLLPNLHMVPSAELSKALNERRSGAIIIAGSGMCTGGRIRHHLAHNVWRKECHVMILGFQARGTTGRALVDGAAYIRLWGEEVRVAAKVHTIGGLSAHADQRELLDWYGNFKNRPRVVLVHGEPAAQETLAQRFRESIGVHAELAEAGREIELRRPS
jgi:metallo-beta-lactamase family protein